jgi:hypothetical protein
MTRALLVLILSPVSALAGLRDGEVVTNATSDSGSTVLASTPLSLVQGSADGVATLNGTMANFSLSSNAYVDNILGSTAAFADARVDFADTIIISAPGVATGEPIQLRIAWNVSTTTTAAASPRIFSLAEAKLEGPLQTWSRSANNFGAPATRDPNGRVEFDFILQEGVSSPDNIRLTAAIQSITGLPGSVAEGTYFGNPSAALSISFIEVVSVSDHAGTTLPIWSIQSTSQFDYGEGSAPPRLSQPSLIIGPSTFGTSHYRFTWQTSELERYELMSSANLTDWKLEATVDGDDTVASIDLPKDGPLRLYRLEYALK